MTIFGLRGDNHTIYTIYTLFLDDAKRKLWGNKKLISKTFDFNNNLCVFSRKQLPCAQGRSTYTGRQNNH